MSAPIIEKIPEDARDVVIRIPSGTSYPDGGFKLYVPPARKIYAAAARIAAYGYDVIVTYSGNVVTIKVYDRSAGAELSAGTSLPGDVEVLLKVV